MMRKIKPFRQFIWIFCCVVTLPLVFIVSFILGGIDAVIGTDICDSFREALEKTRSRFLYS